MTRLTLTVAILTYQRPEMLGRGLRLILDQVRALNSDAAAGILARVLVVDNDPAGSSRPVVAALQDAGLRYVLEPRPGIAAARNRALDESRDSDLLVFIDDDEQPRASWLDTLVATHRDTGATAVAGRVVSQLGADLNAWVAAGDFFERSRMATGTEITIAATGNLLLDLRQVRSFAVRFDERFGLSGGEDSLFSRQLVSAGARIIWCDESVADDYVAADRVTRRWLLARAWSQGNTAGRVEIYLADGRMRRIAARGRVTAGGLTRIGAGIARYLSGLVGGSYRHQARGLRTARRGFGMLSAAAGLTYQEYARESRRHVVLPTRWTRRR